MTIYLAEHRLEDIIPILSTQSFSSQDTNLMRTIVAKLADIIQSPILSSGNHLQIDLVDSEENKLLLNSSISILLCSFTNILNQYSSC